MSSGQAWWVDREELYAYMYMCEKRGIIPLSLSDLEWSRELDELKEMVAGDILYRDYHRYCITHNIAPLPRWKDWEKTSVYEIMTLEELEKS